MGGRKTSLITTSAPKSPLTNSQSTLGVFGKVLFFLLLYIWVRGTLPRFRYDQLMSFGWKFLLPVAMINIIITSLVIALRS